jgi:hypothetical protein
MSAHGAECSVPVVLLPGSICDRRTGDRAEKKATTKSMKTRSNQNNSAPNLAQGIFMMLVSYPLRIVARTQLKLREFQITDKNAEPSQKKRSTSEERKSQARMMNHRGESEDSGLHSHSKIIGLLHKFRICRPLSTNLRRGKKPKEARSK